MSAPLLLAHSVSERFGDFYGGMLKDLDGGKITVAAGSNKFR